MPLPAAVSRPDTLCALAKALSRMYPRHEEKIANGFSANKIINLNVLDFIIVRKRFLIKAIEEIEI